MQHSKSGGGWVTKSCSTPVTPWTGNLPGSSVRGILQARRLEWAAISFSRGSSRPRNKTRSPALQADSLPSKTPGKPPNIPYSFINYGLHIVCNILRTYLLCNWKFVPLDTFTFPPTSISSPLATTSPLFLGVWCFLDSTCKWNHTVLVLKVCILCPAL